MSTFGRFISAVFQRLVDLTDVPSPVASYLLARNSSNTGNEWVPNNGGSPPFVMAGEWSSVIDDYSAAGVDTETVLASPAVSGNNYIYVVDNTHYSAGHGIAIVGAGTAGADLITSVYSVSGGGRIDLNDTIVTTKSAGTTVYHDDTVAIQNYLNEGNLSKSYLPSGLKSIVTSKLEFTKLGTQVFGPGMFGCDLYISLNEYPHLSGPYFTQTPVAIIYQRFDDDDMMFAGSNNCTLNGFVLEPHSTIEMAGYSGIAVGGVTTGEAYETYGSSGIVSSVNILNMNLSRFWRGVTHRIAWSLTIRDTFIEGFRNYGFYMDTVAPYGGGLLDNIDFRGHRLTSTISTVHGANVESCIYIAGGDFMQYRHIHGYLSKHGFESHADQQYMNDAYFDNLFAGYAVKLIGANKCAISNVGHYHSSGNYYVTGNNNVLSTFAAGSGAGYPSVNTGSGNKIIGVS